MTYKPPYEITYKMIDYISQIMKIVGKLSVNEKLSNKPRLRKTNKINSIYSSLAIENNQLSRTQVRDIINGKNVIGPQKDIIEVKNAILVYDQIKGINPYKEEELLKYHKLMMNHLVYDAGLYRQGEEGVFEDEKIIHIAPPAERVPILMKDLFEYVNQYEEHILIKSCVFHYEFEFIHPFSDGNGRMGRLFQTCLLASKDSIFTYLPIETMIKERQSEYYQAIANSNQNGNSNEFIEFMLDIILETIHKMVKDVETYGEYLDIYEKKLYQIMEDEIPYTTKELMNILNMKSRSSLKNIT